MALMNRCAFGTCLRTEDTEEILTMFGHTARVGNLELHAGNFEFARRSDTKRVFVLDRDDYRYQSLRKNIGIYEVPHVVGCLLGRLVSVEGDLIRFRIKESEPSHLLLSCMDDADTAKIANKLNPEAMTSGLKGTFYVVFSLSREFLTEYNRGEDLYDEVYDEDPDYRDRYHGLGDKKYEEYALIAKRLRLSGFYSTFGPQA